MGKKRHALSKDSIAVMRAFGGYALICTRRFKIIYATELATTVFGGKHLGQPELKALVEEAFGSGEQVTRTYTMDTLGALHDIVAQAAPLHSRWVLLTLTDRTEAARANAIRRDFVSNMGHEMRTPTTAVSLLAQAISEVRDDPEQVLHFARQLSQVAERMDRL
ncbi:MAG: hypothetical protein LBU38_07945, partial [Propionibacteriaceae bacterium]|nr:hypothetical protein [Propionibacteriaceae bacterium]